MLRTLSVIVAVWLNVVFQVCAMASMPMDDCPHCPPGLSAGAMSSMPMDCGVLDPIDDPDLVNPSLKTPELSAGFNAITATRWLLPQAPTAIALRRSREDPPRQAHGPPTNVLFCVYLN